MTSCVSAPSTAAATLRPSSSFDFILATGMLEALEGSGYYLRIGDFDYNLPPKSVAAHPAARRDHSRLFLLSRDSDWHKHAVFSDLPRVLRSRSVLVVNE